MPLLCWLGFHDWGDYIAKREVHHYWASKDEGAPYRIDTCFLYQCARCKKMKSQMIRGAWGEEPSS